MESFPEQDDAFCPVALCGAFEEFDEEKVTNNCLKGIKWSPDGSCLLTATEDQLLRVFELPSELGSQQDGDSSASELRSALTAREGDSIYDYCWYPLMNSADALTCCFASTCMRGGIRTAPTTPIPTLCCPLT